MAELLLQRTENQVQVQLGQYSTTAALADIALSQTTWQQIYEDASAYGRKLFDTIFPDEHMRTFLASLPRDERLLLVAEDPLVAAIPWEYLRDQDSKLLASQFPLVRGLPEHKRREGFPLNDSLEIVAVPVSPVDEERMLNIEGEWRNLIMAVTKVTPSQALTLKRVRPPTRSQLEQAQNRKATLIIHFMGHGASSEGKVFLIFEDARARKHLVDAADLVASLEKQVLLVVLNSCLSAIVAPTEFGNIARSLVERGVLYALGMQYILPDDAALVLSERLYGFLLQGYSVEEAVMRTRRALVEPGRLEHPNWLAGIPVLYTSLREPAPPLELASGDPTIQPDPQQLQHTCDLSALPQAQHFLGRGQEMSEVLGVLLAPSAAGFVLLHGLGGIGKTSLARALAERVSWYYDDRVLAYSFETFARLDEHQQRVVDETFAERFYNRLARFYGLDPTQYQTSAELQQAILQQRAHQRSLLVLDNTETLFDAQGQTDPAARSLAAFLARLSEGRGVVLLTSRQVPPTDWGKYTSIWLSGLSVEAGAMLFAELLPQDRRLLAPEAARRTLSQRVQGHPLSIRLLAAHFADNHARTLDVFLEHIEAELEAAEQNTPTSMEDPDRQRTLYACLDYSTKRLTSDQEQVLRAISLFQMPFPPEFADELLANEHTTVHLQTLLRLSLLEISAQSCTFAQGRLLLLELHPMVRWYVQYHLSQPETQWHKHYGNIYLSLLAQAYDEYDKNDRLRTLVRLTLPDSEIALHHLPLAERSRLAYYLAKPYERLGQNRRSIILYEQALEIDQQLGDVRGIAVTQHDMADVLVQQGKPQEALALYELSLRSFEQLGDVRGIAVTQHAMAAVLVQQGKPQEALALYELSLRTKEQLGDLREIAVTQGAMAAVLVQQGKPQEALALYELSLRTKEQLGDLREIAVTQANLCQLLIQLGETHRALVLVWDAYTSLFTHGYIRDSGLVQQLLLSIKWETLGASTFDEIWSEALPDPQPDWLREERSQANQTSVSSAVMQSVRDFVNADDWQATQAVVDAQQEALFQPAVEQLFADNITQARADGENRTAQLLELHLELLRACKEQGIEQAFAMLLANQQETETARNSDQPAVSAEVMQAISAFVNADDWQATQTIVEAQQELLFQPEVERIFEQNIAQARTEGKDRWAAQLEQHLELLRACKTTSIAQAFEPLLSRQRMELPFDEELPAKSIAALLGSPQEKMAHHQYLAEQANATTDEQLKDLLQTIQLALFASDFSQLGRALQGIYAQVWQVITAMVEAGGTDPRLFEQLATNTRAVLSPAKNQLSEWRSTLATTLNQATAKGDRNMASLLQALIGLLDADGNPAGLGKNLQGIYARTWQEIIENLPG